MVRKCSIVGCRGNYDQRTGADDYSKVSVFRFPKDVDRLTLWLQKIPQDLTVAEITDYMGVCERHFDPKFVIREVAASGPDGAHANDATLHSNSHIRRRADRIS